MSEKRPWATKSAAQRFGFVHCPGCNPNELPKAEIPETIQCAWCFHSEDGTHWRYVTIERNKEWRRAHGLPEDEDEIQTSPQTRSALANPPPLPHADTEPAPSFRQPIKREEPDE